MTPYANTIYRYIRRFTGVYILFEIGRTPFKPLALLAFGNILHLAVLEEGFHFNFPPARAEKFLCRAGSTAVLTGLCHNFLLKLVYYSKYYGKGV
jgi:hypothetical protein